ncbi:MAG: NYN domain-containing protein [Clostridia bacterium]
MQPLLYVDGYNVIGAWLEAEKQCWPLDECRDRLIHLMEDYAGYTDQEVWLVFDGYKAARPTRSIDHLPGLTVVCQQMPRYREARVATSDGVEQTIILGR